MPIAMTCASCGHPFDVPGDVAGRQVRCPQCDAPMTVPGVTAVAPRPAVRRGGWDENDRPEEVAGPARTSGKAIWSLILGAASLLCWVFTSIPAVILGILSLRDIGRSRGRVQGQGLAIVGIVLGVVGTLGFIPIIAILIGLLVPAVQKVHEAAARLQSANNLRQIGIAMHNYNDTYGSLPTQAIYGKDGKPLLSWRVAILPFIEQEALYRQFHLDEPWDSAHNKKLLAQMPKTYAWPGSEGTTTTPYQGFVGPGAFFEDSKKLSIPADFRDGTANTIMCVEAADAVPWTKPEDLPFDPAKPLPKLGGHFSNGFNVLLCDASVRFLSNKVGEATLKAAITRNGNEILGPNW